jgi:hypothetical protein
MFLTVQFRNRFFTQLYEIINRDYKDFIEIATKVSHLMLAPADDHKAYPHFPRIA